MAWSRRSGSSLLAGLILVWLLIGVVAAAQRGYFGGSTSCARVSTTALTIVAGPLNYVGANPKIDCELPQPSE